MYALLVYAPEYYIARVHDAPLLCSDVDEASYGVGGGRVGGWRKYDAVSVRY